MNQRRAHLGILVLPLSLFFVLPTGTAAATDPTWARSYGSIHNELDGIVEPVPGGGFVILGTESFEGGNVIVLRLDAAGAIVWQHAYGGADRESAGDVLPMADGGFVLASTTWSFGAGFSDVWVVRLDGAGNILWQRAYGTARDETARGVEPAPDGGVYVVASAREEDLSVSTWVLRLDAAGEVVSQFAYRTGSAPEAAAASLDGGLLLAGEASFPRCSVSTDLDVWVMKLEASGEILWSRRQHSGYPDLARGIVATADGGAALLGWNGLVQSFEVSKLSPGGAVEWRREHGPLYQGSAEWIEGTADGGLLVGGTRSFPGHDVVLLKLDATGVAQWGKAYGLGSFFTNLDYGRSVREIPGDGIVVGATTGSLAPAGNGIDFWVLRLDDTGASAAPCGIELKLVSDERSAAVVSETLPVVRTAPVISVTATSSDPLPYAATSAECANAGADPDGDAVPADRDNCPDSINPDQADADRDGIGDLCDVCPTDPWNDPDADGICGALDNCPSVWNPQQGDANADGEGDVCEPRVGDADCDGLPDDLDACPNSNLGATVAFPPFGAGGGALCDTGVPNYMLFDGCTILDLVERCRADAANRGDFASCVARVCAELRTGGAITGRESSRIVRCAVNVKPHPAALEVRTAREGRP